MALRLPQGGKAVGGFTGLGDHDHQNLRIQEQLPVPEFRRQFHPCWELRQVFQNILRRHAHMPCGTAGDDMHRGDIRQQLVGETGLRKIDFSVPEDAVQRVAHGGWLLVNLLEHKMLVPALLGGLGVPGDFGGFMLHDVAVQVVEGDGPRRQPRNLEILDEVNRAGIGQNGRNIGGQITLPAGNAEHHGAVLPGDKDLAREVLEHQGEGIGTAHPDHGTGDSVHRPDFVLFVVVIDEFYHNFRIGFGIEAVVMAQELRFQLHIVFDNTVVDTDHVGFHRSGTGTGAVAADMRMGVGLAGFAVGCPAGVADAAGAFQGVSVVGLFGQVPQLAGGLDHFRQIRSIPDCQAGRVIAAVFQLFQAFQQDGRRLMLPGKPNNSAHGLHPPPSNPSVRCAVRLQTPNSRSP